MPATSLGLVHPYGWKRRCIIDERGIWRNHVGLPGKGGGYTATKHDQGEPCDRHGTRPAPPCARTVCKPTEPASARAAYRQALIIIAASRASAPHESITERLLIASAAPPSHHCSRNETLGTPQFASGLGVSGVGMPLTV